MTQHRPTAVAEEAKYSKYSRVASCQRPEQGRQGEQFFFAIRRGLAAHEHVATDPGDGKHGQLEGGGDACLGSMEVGCINMANGTEAEENT